MPAKKSPTLHPDLESVLVTDAQIRRRVKSLGRELKKTYGNEEITVVAIMNGALVFTADLLREVDNTIRLDCIRTTSYGSATESHGTPKLVHGLTSTSPTATSSSSTTSSTPARPSRSSPA